MPTNASRYSDDGFTLAEVLVALGIVVLVGIAVLGGVISAQVAQRSAEGTDTAVQVGVDRLEQVSQLEWDAIGFHEATLNTTEHPGYNTAAYYYPCGTTTGCYGEPVTYLPGTPSTNPLHATVTMSGFTVHTYITWVLPTGETVYPVNQEGQRYASKRVRVVVEGTRAGKSFTETAETVIAPRVNQTPPPSVPIVSASAPTIEATTSTPVESASVASTPEVTAPVACPEMVTAVGIPAVVEWNSVPVGAVSYRVLVNGTVRTTFAHDGYSRYSWTSPLYASATTYEVQSVSATGAATSCAQVIWTPPTAGAPVSTCPSGVTVVKTPKTLTWNSVPSGVTAYQVRVQSVLKATIPHDGRAKYTWARTSVNGVKSTYEVRGVTATGGTACPVVLYNPNA